MAPDNTLLKIMDLQGGINDGDAPFSLAETQVTQALNVDYRAGKIGNRRSGLFALSLTGSLFERHLPTASASASIHFNALSGNLTVPTSGLASSTNVMLICFVATLGTISGTPTFNGVGMALIQSFTVGALTLVAYRVATPTLTGGTIGVTTTAGARTAIYAQYFDDVDNSASPASVSTDGNAGAVSVASPSSGSFNEQYLVLCGLVDPGVIGQFDPAVGRQGSGTELDAGNLALFWEFKAGMKPTTQFNLPQNPASAWAAIMFGLKGRVVTTETSRENALRALMRFSPTNDIVDDELWIQDHRGRLDRRVAGVWQLGMNRQNWKVGSTIPQVDSNYYATNSASLHEKHFLALDGILYANRMALWDGTVLRWAGFATPVAPTGADTAGAGTFTGTRFYRLRYIQMNGSVIVRRSEPSAVLTFVPSGANTGIVVTKPAAGGFLTGEGETHWELEASTDNGTFYLLATTVVGTTTVTDTTALATPTSATYSAGALAPSVGEYIPLTAARHVVVDQDRLLGGGSPAGLAIGGINYTLSNDSRLFWTPLRADTSGGGIGNDERVPVTSRFFQDLDGVNSGRMTMLVPASLGGIWVFKDSRIYKLVRAGGTPAYTYVQFTDTRGCVLRAAANGTDSQGNPCVYFTDPIAGPCKLDAGGLTDLMADRTVMLHRIYRAGGAVARVFFYPKWWLVWYSIQLDSPTLPNYTFCWNIRTKSWTDYDGQGGSLLSGMLFPAASTLELRPYVLPSKRTTGLLFEADRGTTDDGVAYTGRIVTKAYNLGAMLQEFGIDGAVLHALGSNDAGSAVTITAVKDSGAETKVVANIALTPVVGQEYVTVPLDNLTLNECHQLQIKFEDASAATTTWTLEALVGRTMTGSMVG